MRKFILTGVFALVVQITAHAESLPVKDNLNVALTLSQNNYNRVYIKNDELWDFSYPPGALGVKKDRADGGVYLMPASTTPFTLFVTTKNGHHFTVTVNSEEGLGKTIELIPQLAVAAKSVVSSARQNPLISEAQVPEAILALLSHMERHEPFADVKVSHQYGKAERWAKGLSLLPKETWEGQGLKGELVELYNGGSTNLVLSQEWFAKDNTLAIKFSKPTLLPRERAMLYRVQEVRHG
jgi:conjugal transfer pilus assembly protein TraK